MKQAGRILGKNGVGALWLKEHTASERAMADSLKGYFSDLEQQVFEKVNAKVQAKIDEAVEELEDDEEIGEFAEELADELIDVDEVYDEVLEAVKPEIYDQVARGAMTEWNLALPQKNLDLTWIKTPLWTYKEVCRDDHGQFASCGTSLPSSGPAIDEIPVPFPSSLRGNFAKLPDSRSACVATASDASRILGNLSISAEADKAVDKLMDRELGAIRDQYGPELGNVIIGAGFLGGLAGAAATLAAAGLVSAGAWHAGSYTGAASAIAVGIGATIPVSATTARYAITPLIGMSRWIQRNFSGAVGAKSETDMEQITQAAQVVWDKITEKWLAIAKQQGWLKAAKADEVGAIVGGLRNDLPAVMRDRVEKFTEDILARPYWRGVAETIRDDIASEIRTGVLDGLSGKQIAGRLRDVVGDDARANNIARTETTGALNAGHQATREELLAEGLIDGKEWLSIEDHSTRPTHLEANGQQVEVMEKFTVGDEEAMYPGDPDLSAEERCNCRCTSLSTFSDEEIKQLQAWVRAAAKWFTRGRVQDWFGFAPFVKTEPPGAVKQDSVVVALPGISETIETYERDEHGLIVRKHTRVVPLPLPKRSNKLAKSIRRFAKGVSQLLDQLKNQPAPVFQVPTPLVSVAAPVVQVEAPVVNVAPAQVNVEAPQVNVEAPQVNPILAMPITEKVYERDANNLIVKETTRTVNPTVPIPTMEKVYERDEHNVIVKEVTRAVEGG